MKLNTVLSMSMSIILSLLLTFSLTTSSVSGETAAAAAEKKPKCPGKVKVLVEEIPAGTFLQFKDLKKKILPLKSGDFSSPIPGLVKTIEKNVGSSVKIGDVVVVIDREPIKKEIARAKAKIRQWKNKLRKYRNYKVRIPKAERRAERIIKEAEELIALKEAQLEKCDITSPADGMIAALKVNQGDYISEGFVLGTIINIDKVKMPLTTYADKVTNGQKIKIKVKELVKTVDGVVQKDADGGTNIFIDNQDKQIMPAMSTHFRILLKEYKNVVVLPEAKFLKDDTGLGPFVYIAEGNLAKKAYLKTGPTEKGNVLVLEGLAIGDEMIVSEILSAKQATVKEDFPCLYNNKKIKIMEMDEAKGKFVKRKKGKAPVKPVKKEKKIKPEPVKKPKVEKKTPPKPPKPPKVVKKKEKPKDILAVQAFLDYLTYNKDTLRYDRFKKVTREDSIIIKIYCDAAAKNRILRIIEKFRIKKYYVYILKEKEKYKIDAFFKAERPVKMKRETFLNRFRIGAHVGYYKMFDSNFEDIYGRMVSVGLDISVMLSEKLDIWFSGGISSKTAAIEWAEEDLKFEFTPLSLDLRYFFKRSEKWDFYAGAGFNYYAFEDTNPIENVKDKAFGINILGGTYYHLSQNFSLQLLLRFNMVKKTIENTDNDLNMNSAELLFGISYGF